jgi:hypothetical protein
MDDRHWLFISKPIGTKKQKTKTPSGKTSQLCTIYSMSENVEEEKSPLW